MITEELRNLVGAGGETPSHLTLDQISTAVKRMLQRMSSAVSTAGGSANAITADFTPDITTLTDGMTVRVRGTTANTTATPTFAPDAVAAKTIVKGNNQPLAAGDIAGAGHWIELQYDAALDKWVLSNPANGLGSAGLSASGVLTVTSTSTLGATAVGATVVINSAGATTSTLMAASTVAAGKRIEFFNIGAGVGTISRGGADVFIVNDLSVNSLALYKGDSLTLESNGVGGWYAVGGSAQLPYAASSQGLRASSFTLIAATGSIPTSTVGGTVLFNAAGATTQTLPQVSAVLAGKRIEFFNDADGVVTITAGAGNDIHAGGVSGTVSSLLLKRGDSLTLESDGGVSWVAVGGSAQLVFAGSYGVQSFASVPTTSGTTVTLATGVPATAKRIRGHVFGVSNSAGSDVLVQVGTSGGFVTAGYSSVANDHNGSSTSSAGMIVTKSNGAASVLFGSFEFSRAANNDWVFTSTLGQVGALLNPGAGGISLGAALDRIRLTTVSGTDTFDAGYVSISWE